MLSNNKLLVERQLKNTIKKIIKEILTENTDKSVTRILSQIGTEIDTYKKFYSVLDTTLGDLSNKLFEISKDIQLERKEKQEEINERSLEGNLTEEDKNLFEKDYQTQRLLVKVNNLIFDIGNYKLDDTYIDNAFNKLSTIITDNLKISFSGDEQISQYIFDPKDSQSIYTIIRFFKAQKEGFEPGGFVRYALENLNEAIEIFNMKMREINSESEFEDIKEKDINFKGLINQIYLSLESIMENFKNLIEKSDSTLDIESIKTKSTPSDSMSGARDFKPHRFYEQTKRSKKNNKI